jgi:hypothetical protein
VTPGVVFLSKNVGGRSAHYNVVDGDNRILGYHLVMAPTTLEQARLRLISELPSDAQEVKRRVLRGCTQIRYRSATLDAIFRDDPVAHATGYGGQVDVEFASDDPEVMNPKAVTTVVVDFFSEEVDC